MVDTENDRAEQLDSLRELAKQYHLDFFNSSSIPKPHTERRRTVNEIYEIANVHGISPETVDALMDEAENRYARYPVVA